MHPYEKQLCWPVILFHWDIKILEFGVLQEKNNLNNLNNACVVLTYPLDDDDDDDNNNNNIQNDNLISDSLNNVLAD